MSKVTRRTVLASVSAAAIASAIDPALAADAPPQPNAEALARVAMVLDKYGERFTAQQKAEIRQRIIDNQGGLDAMRAYPLDNSIEPATLFRIYVKPRPKLKVQPHK